LHHLTGIGTGAADQKRHPFFHGVDCGDGQGFELIKQQIVTFAVSAGCGDIVNAVFDNSTYAFLKIIDSDRLRRPDIHGIRRSKRRHHS
jgi:hypothetical protein